MLDTKNDILTFWFEEISPQQWFQVNAEFDELIRQRYLKIYEAASQGDMDHWQGDADGCLALCLVLDQFPRNMFRGKPEAFATDKKALLISKHAIHRGYDTILSAPKRRFLYLPFEHSENLNDQKKSLELFKSMKNDDPLGYDYALRHYEVIEKFGRFPSRNAALGRDSTPEEEEYLKNPRF